MPPFRSSSFLLAALGVASAVPAFAAPPTAPGDLRASVYSDSAAELFWGRSTDDGTVRGYEIRRDGALLDTRDASSYFDDALVPGVRYAYSVTAIDADGERSEPATVSLVGGDRDSPGSSGDDGGGNGGGTAVEPAASLRAEAYSSNALELFWDRAAAGGSSYRIFRTEAGAGDPATGGAPLATTNGTSFFDSGLAPDRAWRYAVVAVDADGRAAEPAFVTVAAGDASTPGTDAPAPPAGLRATAYSGTAAELFWERVPAAGLRYEIRRDGAALGTTDGTSFFDDALTPGAMATYEVVATAADGARSAPATVLVDTPGGASGSEPEPARLLSRDRYEAVLAEVVALINADPLEAARSDAFLATEDFTSRTSAAARGASFVEAQSSFDRYACEGGGTVRSLQRPPTGGPLDVAFDACVLDGAPHDGAYRFRFTGREGTSTAAFEDLDVPTADGDRLRIDGARNTRADRIGFARSRTWSDVRLSREDLELRDYDAFEGKRTGADGSFDDGVFSVRQPDGSLAPVRFVEFNAATVASFEATAPWTDGAPLVVEAELRFDGDHVGGGGTFAGSDAEALPVLTSDPSVEFPDGPVRFRPPEVVDWTNGGITVEAADGSRLRIDAATGDPATFFVYLDGSDAPIVRAWDDGFRVRCALGGACSGRDEP